MHTRAAASGATLSTVQWPSDSIAATRRSPVSSSNALARMLAHHVSPTMPKPSITRRRSASSSTPAAGSTSAGHVIACATISAHRRRLRFPRRVGLAQRHRLDRRHGGDDRLFRLREETRDRDQPGSDDEEEDSEDEELAVRELDGEHAYAFAAAASSTSRNAARTSRNAASSAAFCVPARTRWNSSLGSAATLVNVEISALR